jgi:hypothetical protein
MPVAVVAVLNPVLVATVGLVAAVKVLGPIKQPPREPQILAAAVAAEEPVT